MTTRAAHRAGTFYPAGERACLTLLSRCLEPIPPGEIPPGTVTGGLVPHAGWTYSGHTAGRTFAAIGDPAPRTFLFFGAVHVPGVRQAVLSSADRWETPLGDVRVDREIADLLLDTCGDFLEEDDVPHRVEHSIEVQLPFVRHLYPDAAIVAVGVPPYRWAPDLGRAAGRALVELPDRVVVIASTDLTHYGPSFYGFAPKGTGPEAHRWSKEVNDREFLDHVLRFDAEGALKAAERSRSACGAGAAAAAMTACREMGADRAALLEHVTSHEVQGRADPTDFVGYASVVFVS